jgi:metallo-beta-lactamase class B
MTRRLASGTIVAVFLALSLVSLHAQTAAPAPNTVDGLLISAKTAAGLEWPGTYVRLCIPTPAGRGAAADSDSAGGTAARGGANAARGGGAPARGAAPAGGGRGTPARATWYADPAKVADNFYFLGTKVHSAWALVGSDGIIILEALYDYAAPDEIVGGMKSLGLDPSKVKYILLSHAHADHDGGAYFLQDSMPTAHLVYGAADWDAVDKSTNHAGGKPKHDTVGTDGMKVSVGDASLQIVTMPGHTEGTLSFLFEIKDNGRPIRVAYVGGTAIPFNGTAAYYDEYLASSRKMAKAAADFGATALMSNHTEFDNAYFKAHTAANRKPGEANPFDVGQAAVARYFTTVEQCATATKLRATGRM